MQRKVTLTSCFVVQADDANHSTFRSGKSISKHVSLRDQQVWKGQNITFHLSPLYKDIWKGRLTVRWCEKVHHGAEMGVTVKGDGLNLSSRPRKGNVHTRPPLLCRVALSYASVAPTSSSKRRLDQLPSRCSIALVAFRVKIPELFTPVSPSIHYLLKHCLPLRTWPGVAPARYTPFTCMQIAFCTETS